MDEPTPSPTEQRFTMGEVSSRLDVPAHQLRRWCQYHAAHLSPEANPAESGIERRLTERDISLLSSVRDMRAQGLTSVLINVRLQAVKVGEVESTHITEASQATADALQQTQTALVVVEAIQTAISPLETRQTDVELRIQDLENTYRVAWSRIQAMDAQRMRIDVVWIATAAFIAGLVVGLAVWMLQ